MRDRGSVIGDLGRETRETRETRGTRETRKTREQGAGETREKN
jgi:hypothetical protein